MTNPLASSSKMDSARLTGEILIYATVMTNNKSPFVQRLALSLIHACIEASRFLVFFVAIWASQTLGYADSQPDLQPLGRLPRSQLRPGVHSSGDSEDIT
ncbi:unnamed protein product [Schistocephalus solidus]|uniref:Proton_antipo_M domain-containing protein n=1 Tax=Schistocephalus solidus TaxID=70667 RepID=A0A183SS57_SCHSO|nr:unnamed protein product [Schistocephalus solidus]